MMRSKTRGFRRLLLGLWVLVGLCLPCEFEGHGALSPGLLALIGPAPAYGQTPCTTHIYEVLSVEEDDDPGNDNCPWENCTASVWVRTLEDGVEVRYEEVTGLIGIPYQFDCPSYACSWVPPVDCDWLLSGPRPCRDAACTSYMAECGKILAIQWWNDTYAPAHGLPPIGQETNECDEERDEDNGECKNLTGAPINVTSGNMHHTEQDITLKIPGIGLNFSRHYNSRSTRTGPVGYGWTHSFEVVLEPEGDSRVRVLGQAGKGVTFREHAASYPQHGYDTRDYQAKFGRRKERMSWDPDLATYTWASRNGKFYQLDSDGKATAIQDGKGNELTLSHDPGTGLLASVTDNFGRSLTFAYDAGKLQTVTDPAGNTVTFHYTGENLTQVDYPDGRFKSYLYEDPGDPHNLTAIVFGRVGIDPTEVEYQWSYDTQDRAESSSKAGGNEQVTLTFLSDTQTEMTDSLGRITTFTFERVQGRLLITDVDGPGCPSCGAAGEMSYVYDPDNQNLLSSTDGENNVTIYSNHDDFGQPWTTTEAYGSPEQRIVNYTYHPTLPGVMTIRSPGSVLNPGGPTFKAHDYDDPDDPADNPDSPNENPTLLLHRHIELGYTKRVSDGTVYGLKKITRYHYNGFGQVTEIDGPRGDVTDTIGFAYDEVTGDLLSRTEPLSGSTTYTDYDDNGNPGTVTDVNGNVTTYTYDERNRVETVSQVGAGPTGGDLVTGYY